MFGQPVVCPLGDQAALLYLADESTAASFAASIRRANFPWLIEVVQAYKSVAVFYDVSTVGYAAVSRCLLQCRVTMKNNAPTQFRRHLIPCCYEFQQDLHRIVEVTGLSCDEIIRIHTETEFTIFAIGFCPGFPYLGYLPESFQKLTRLSTPRLKVPQGSVAITGRQSGIYTEERPGGWNIIGRTPLGLVNVAEEYFPLRTGDRVHFVRIDESEFNHLQGMRLELKPEKA